MKGPIFIVGTPRSGTTLLSVILNKHSQVFFNKTSVGQRIFYCLDALKNRNKYLDKEKIITYFQDIVQKDYKGYLYAEVKHFPFWQPDETIAQYLQRVTSSKAAGNGKKIWGDKTPELLHYTEYIYSIFPGAKIIQVIRDGHASVSSLKQRQYVSIDLACWQWRKDILRGMINKYLYGKDRYFILRYEDILTDEVNTLKIVCSFLGIEFEEGILNLKDENVSGQSYIGTKIDKSKVDTWKKELSKKEIETIEKRNGKIMHELGYSLVNPTYQDSLTSISSWKVLRLKFAQLWRALFRVKRMHMSRREWVEIRIPLRQRIQNFVGATIRLIFSEAITASFKTIKDK